MQTFFVRHTLRCPNGGLTITRHNEIRDEIIHLARKSFYPHYVHGEPLIYQGYSRSEGGIRNSGRIPETRGVN